MNDLVNKKTAELAASIKERNTTFTEWYRGLLTISVGLLGLLVTLGPKSQTLLQHQLYSYTLSSLGLGILFSVIALYSNVDVQNRAVRHQGQNVLRSSEGKETLTAYIAPKKIFVYVRNVSFFCYSLGLVLLIIYSITKDKT